MPSPSYSVTRLQFFLPLNSVTRHSSLVTRRLAALRPHAQIQKDRQDYARERSHVASYERRGG